MSHPASATRADSEQVQRWSLAPPAGYPDRSSPRLTLTAAAAPRGGRRPQQRAVNLLQPLQVALPARAGLAGHLLHGCHHGVEIVLQGAGGAGLRGGASELEFRLCTHPPLLQRQACRCTESPVAPPLCPGLRQELPHEGLPTSRAPLLPCHSCCPMPPAAGGPLGPSHGGAGGQLVPGNVGKPGGRDGLWRPPSLGCH